MTAVSNLIHRLLNHSHRVRPLRSRVHAPPRNLCADLALELLELDRALLLADLQLALLEDLLNDRVDVGRVERLGEVRGGRDLPFRDVDEDVVDLEHFAEVGLGAGTPCPDGVLVARNLEQR